MNLVHLAPVARAQLLVARNGDRRTESGDVETFARSEMNKIHVDNSNIFGAVAMQAAYNECGDWMDQLLVYLEGNIDYVRGFLAEHMPSVGCHKPEATYLMWLDFRGWGLDEDALRDFLVHKAKLGMNRGSMFGVEGTCFTRMNIGAPRATIERAMNQLLEAARNEGLV